MSDTLKLYHIVPPRVEGDTLMPLSSLKTAFPALYDLHAAKYVGREELMAQKIPILDCLWNDVLQFSPVHPEQIRDTLKEIGFGWQTMLAFEIDPKQFGINETNAVTFKHLPRQFGDFTMKDEEFERFTEQSLKGHADLPFATKAHFKEAKETSNRPFLFLWVPHVLYRGTVRVDTLKIIEI